MDGNEPPLATFSLESLGDTDRCGALLADQLPDASCVALRGTLGAGKTRLVRAILASCGIEAERVKSPTFSLLQSYQTRRGMVHHLDAYRLDDEDAFWDLGVEELLSAPGTLSLVEWADRVEGALPPESLWIQLDWYAGEQRDVTLRGAPARWSGLAEMLKGAFLTSRERG
jgi:tRNA threonylcarbamoyladenosine biosynthesis protein TsaE